MTSRSATTTLALLLSLSIVPASFSQTAEQPSTPETSQSLPDYPGVRIRVPGAFVTPVPNQPFSARVDISSSQILPSGQVLVRTTMNRIARDSSGRMHNERRRLVPPGFEGEPDLLSTHIYDPSTRLNIYLNPSTHIARETVLRRPMPTAPSPATTSHAGPQTSVEQLGAQAWNGLTLDGTRKSHTVAADQSGTGKPVIVVDEYWYSPELFMYLILKHNDPRTGEQIVAITQIDRHAPDSALFGVPADFKVVDETPAEQIEKP